MTYEQVKSLKPEAFKRFCGVGATTFAKMVSVKRTTATSEAKKALLQPDSVLEVVVVDVTESPIERPKKNNDKCFPVKKSIIP